MKFYRTKSALQIKIIKPTLDKTGKFMDKEGSVLLEFAKGEDKKYDWKNKIMFALGIEDFPVLFTALEAIRLKNVLPKDDKGNEEVKIIHKYNEQTKTLILKKSGDGYFLGIVYNKEYISVFLTYGECLTLYHYLTNVGFDIIRI